MEFDRNDVKMAVAHYLAMCVITSGEQDNDAVTLRYSFITMSAIRCHLFNDTSQEICGEILLSARDIILSATEQSIIIDISERQAKTLAVSGFAKTAIASILDYTIYFDEMDEMRSRLIIEICNAADLDAKQTVSFMAPAFNAIYTKWS